MTEIDLADGHLVDAYDALVKAKKMIALVRSSTPATPVQSLSAANRSRVERALLITADAVASLKATLEVPCNP